MTGIPQLKGASHLDRSHSDISDLTQQIAEMNKIFLRISQSNQQVNVVNPSCETCGGPHHYYECQATSGFTQGDVYAATGNYNMGANQMTKMEKTFNERPQGALPSNTIPNPREDIKVITTQSGITLAGPSVPSPNPPSSSKEVERDPEPTMDQVHISSSESTARVPSPVIQPALASKSNEIHERNPHQPPIPYPSSLAKALAQMPKYAKMLKDLFSNKEKLLEFVNTPLNENCSALKECMALADLGASINLMPLYVWKKLMLPELVPTRMTFELANRSVAYPAGITEDVFVQVGKFTFLVDFIIVDYDVDPRVPLILGRPFLRTARALGDVYGEELTLRVGDEKLIFNVKKFKDLPPHLEYAFLEGTSKLPVIITKDLKKEEKDQLIKVLKSHKQAITWKISDIRGIDPNFCSHKILMEDDFKPAVQHQRRVNPKIHKVIKAEVIKLLDAGLVYPISDSPWVSVVHVVPKKGGMTMVTNDNNELFLTRLVRRWRVFIDYLKMPFGLSNAQGTFQRCMMAIFHDMIKKTMEVFMDDFLVFGDSFSSCLSYLDMMLKRISKNGIEVDKAKLDVIAKLPPPTTVKGIRSFLGHAVFYQKFIQDFSKIAQPMTHLLEKETPFVFSKECFESFEYLKKKLTEALILVAPDWDLPFEIMCDASDFAVGAVLASERKNIFSLYIMRTIVYTDHSALKYLFAKQDDKPRLLRWILLLQEFNIEIRDNKEQRI
ncbi:reverse transcriptase domain-containing protein [Tanacetum coccineum]